MHGHVSPASDVFAYGILMWELYTGEHAYKGVPRALLGHNITKQGMRPVFPPDTPFEWQFLACRCWESDPGIRPSFHQILEELQRIQARWIASRSSTDESVAATSATQFSSSSYMCSDSSPQLLHRCGVCRCCWKGACAYDWAQGQSNDAMLILYRLCHISSACCQVLFQRSWHVLHTES